MSKSTYKRVAAQQGLTMEELTELKRKASAYDQIANISPTSLTHNGGVYHQIRIIVEACQKAMEES